MKKIFIYWQCLISLNATLAQGLTVQFELWQAPVKTLYIGFYEGGKAYHLDTVLLEGGRGRFSSDKVAPGMFFCTSAKGKFFDFIVSKTHNQFTIGLNLEKPDSAWAFNSEENEAYFRFEQRRKQLEIDIEKRKQQRQFMAQATRSDTAVIAPIDRQIEALYLETDRLALEFIQKRPGDLFTKMLKSVRPPDPPPSLPNKLPNGSPNPAWGNWQRQHYWDNTDFNQTSLLRNNFWQVYFDHYFNKFVARQPDSIIQAVDHIMALTPADGDFYRFILLRVTPYYEQLDAPGADRVFVHLVDHYFKVGQTPWLDQATLERLKYKANLHRPNLTGSLCPNLILPDEKDQLVELYDIQAPRTILIFYSPLCQHCMEVMPKIYQIWLDFAPASIAAIAINTDKQGAYWKKFIGQQQWAWHDLWDEAQLEQLDRQFGIYNLPVIYILDADKRILHKRVQPAALAEWLRK